MKSLIANLTLPQATRRVGPMAAKKLIGLLMCEDPMMPMDDFAK